MKNIIIEGASINLEYGWSCGKAKPGIHINIGKKPGGVMTKEQVIKLMKYLNEEIKKYD